MSNQNDLIGRRMREMLWPPRKCGALTRDGGSCERIAIPGGGRCSIHSGKNPEVRRAAQQRLLAMIEPALDRLLSFVTERPPCPHCGRSDADRDPVVLAAVKIILDRAGFAPKENIPTEQPNNLDVLSPQEAQERLLELRSRLDVLITEQSPRALPPAIDAEVIPKEKDDDTR